MTVKTMLTKIEAMGFKVSDYQVRGVLRKTRLHGNSCNTGGVAPISLPLKDTVTYGILYGCNSWCRESLTIYSDKMNESYGEFIGSIDEILRFSSQVTKFKDLSKLNPVISAAERIAAPVGESIIAKDWWVAKNSELRAQLRAQLRGPLNKAFLEASAKAVLHSYYKSPELTKAMGVAARELAAVKKNYLVYVPPIRGTATYRPHSSVSSHWVGATEVAYGHPSGFLVDVPEALALESHKLGFEEGAVQRVRTHKTPSEASLEALKVLFKPQEKDSPYSSLSAAFKASQVL